MLRWNTSARNQNKGISWNWGWVVGDRSQDPLSGLESSQFFCFFQLNANDCWEDLPKPSLLCMCVHYRQEGEGSPPRPGTTTPVWWRWLPATTTTTSTWHKFSLSLATKTGYNIKRLSCGSSPASSSLSKCSLVTRNLKEYLQIAEPTEPTRYWVPDKEAIALAAFCATVS